MKFEQLEVLPAIIRALQEQGIVTPTVIQEKTIPLAHAGKDIIGMSKTGSGKTAAFGIPILEKVVPGQGIQALILSPTRELALQISTELVKWSKYKHCFITTVFGGMSIEPQIEKLRRTDIVVGTPGRVLDHLGRGTLDLRKIMNVVLDEADKMVEMGFIEDIEEILQKTPRHRQMFLFGATLSNEIEHIKQKYMHDVVVAEAELQVQGDLLEQYYYNVEQKEKFSLLVHVLKTEKNIERAIIFCSARSTVEAVYRNLHEQGIKAEMIHGKMRQTKRLQVIGRFNEGKYRLLIASAVAARGLHIEDVTHVFNYDLSQDPQEYIHRVGRTARAGNSGKAITLLCARDYEAFEQIIRRYRVDVQELNAGNFLRVPFQLRQRYSRGSQQPGRFGTTFHRSSHVHQGGRSEGDFSRHRHHRREETINSGGWKAKTR